MGANQGPAHFWVLWRIKLPRKPVMGVILSPLIKALIADLMRLSQHQKKWDFVDRRSQRREKQWMRFLRGPKIKEKANLHSRISILDGRQVSRDVWSGHSVSFLASLLAPVIRPSMMTVSSNFASRDLIKLFSGQLRLVPLWEFEIIHFAGKSTLEPPRILDAEFGGWAC